MTKKEKAAYVMAELEALYPETPIPLDHSDPFTLLVAVVLSAQCTDARVNTVTPALFAKARTPQAMAALSVEEIAEIIRPCGLTPMKSKGIHQFSKMIMELHGGEVPQSFDALEAMPAVGHKTASVVMSQAFGVPAFPVDTHIHRLMYRWGSNQWQKCGADRKRRQSALPPRKSGTSFTCKSFFTAGSTAPPAAGPWIRTSSPPVLGAPRSSKPYANSA